MMESFLLSINYNILVRMGVFTNLSSYEFFYNHTLWGFGVLGFWGLGFRV